MKMMRGILSLLLLSLLVAVSIADETGPLCSIDPPAKPHKLSICTMIKNEALTIEEWLAYHLLIKVDHFFIYDDGSTDNIAEVLAPYIKLGYVTLIPWDDTKQTVVGWMVPRIPEFTRKQRFAIADCLFHHQNETEWFGVFDVDEFLVVNSFFRDMDGFLPYAIANADDYPMPMTIFGPAWHEQTPTGKWTFKEYQMRGENTTFGISPLDKKFLGKSLYKSGCGLPNVHFTNELREGCKKYRGWISGEGSGQHLPLTINHYPVKSWEHYVKKMDMWSFYLNKEEYDKFHEMYDKIWDNSMEKYVWKIEEVVNCMRNNK